MKETQIVFLILPQIHLLDLAGADQVMYEAIEHGIPVKIQYCSIATSVTTSTHLPFGNIQHFSSIQLTKGDYLIIPGAETTYLLSEELGLEKSLFQWILTAHEDEVNICSICTGAFLLARVGVLDGKLCTTHWKKTGQLQQLFPKLKVIDNILYTEDEGVFTSAGVTSGIDLALNIIGKLTNDMMAYKIARELVVYIRRQGSQSQNSIYLSYRNHIHAGIHKVQDSLIEHLHKKTNLEELAELANMSARNLTRLFRKETGVSIHEYLTLLRKEKIGELLKNPDVSRSQIALQCGLASERQISRIMQKGICYE